MEGERERVDRLALESACQKADCKSLVGRIVDGLRVFGVEGRAYTRGTQLVFEGWAPIRT